MTATINMFINVHRKSYCVGTSVFKEYHYGIIISLVCYFVSGMTGRSFFPMLPNSFLWVILGILVASVKVLDDAGKEGHDQT
jgi:hypothetical protein